jgi:hypothetical protein
MARRQGECEQHSGSRRDPRAPERRFVPSDARFRRSGRGTAFAINLYRLFATDLFAAILLVQGLPFLSAVALVWLERPGDRKLRKIAAIRTAA